ncbi:MAG: type I-C CRISPR-associated protein Cas8c/Csd1 [Akkermansiaceae bacterium]|jgi:CRISPR-associated protein Csd1|nr:type I-C CRISPR-associated protein Cas8c/Csd1 [Luteolibacter sp.]
MILQSLNDLYTRLAEDPSYEIAPPGFSPQKVSYRIVLKPDGSLFAVEDARIDGSPINLQIPQPEKRTSAVKSQFLCDKREYVLGMGASGLRLDCFEEFKKKHLGWEKEINSPTYAVLCRFLENWSPERYEEFNSPADVFESFGVFQILGEKTYIHDCPIIKKWWSERSNSSDEGSTRAQCLITGEIGETIGIHPDIKGFKSSVGLVGIQSNSSYESYGKSKTENCPISKAAAFNYATALTSLLAGPQKKKHRTRLVDTTVVHWTETQSELEDIFAAIFGESSEKNSEGQDLNRQAQINRLLAAIKSGTHYNELGDPKTPFYLLGLEQPNPGRFSIRFFHRSTIADLIDKLHDHQRCLEIIREFTEPVGKRQADSEFPAIWQILRETARVADEIPPLLSGAIARSIIEGTPYPEGLFTAIIRRIHADRSINYLRAATLKAVLTRNHNQIIPIMLDTQNTDPAYLLGRLFAALEKTQEDSLGNLNAGIRDRFYSSASATPAAVFPRLLRTYQHHLSGLNGGAKVNRERLIQEILSSVDASGFPNQLSLKKQGIFAIGYYHQRKDFFTKKETETTNA